MAPRRFTEAQKIGRSALMIKNSLERDAAPLATDLMRLERMIEIHLAWEGWTEHDRVDFTRESGMAFGDVEMVIRKLAQRIKAEKENPGYLSIRAEYGFEVRKAKDYTALNRGAEVRDSIPAHDREGRSDVAKKN